MNTRIAALLLCLAAAAPAAAQERGPYRFLGRKPDLTLYSCGSSASGTRIPNAISITDSVCAVWALAGTAVTRNGIQVDTGDQILFFLGSIYDSRLGNWYQWNGTTWIFVGADPQSPPLVGYYVSTTGSNGNSCMQSQSPTTPKRSIVAGLACLAAGDTLLVRGGTYDESILNTQSVIQVASGTSWANKVRIAAYPGETVWMAPTSSSIFGVIWFVANAKYIEFDGINLDARNAGGIAGAAGLITGAIDPGSTMPDHIRFQNAEIIRATQSNGCVTSNCGETDGIEFGAHEVEGAVGGNEAINVKVHGGNGSLGYGIYLAGPNNLVDHCEIYDTSSAGVHIYNGGGDSADNNIVRNTRIHDLTTSGQQRGWGILISGDHNQIFNNVISGVTLPFISTSAGLYVYTGTGNVLANNTIVGNAMPGVLLNAGVLTTVVRDNLSYLNSGGNYSDGGSGTLHDHNLEGAANPLFAGATDYHLTAGSPARDVGIPVSGITTDLDGIARPQGPAPDIGAYEFH